MNRQARAVRVGQAAPLATGTEVSSRSAAGARAAGGGTPGMILWLLVAAVVALGAYGMGADLPDLRPILIVQTNKRGALVGYVGLQAQAKKKGGRGHLARLFKDAPGILGLGGFDLPKRPGITNKIENGRLEIGLSGVRIALGKVLDGTIDIQANDERITTFAGSVTVAAQGLNSGQLGNAPESEAMRRQMVAEYVAVGNAEGAALGPKIVEEIIDRFRNPMIGMTSMMRDRVNGKRIEHAALVGSVVSRGAVHGIATPVTETLYALLAPVAAEGR